MPSVLAKTFDVAGCRFFVNIFFNNDAFERFFWKFVAQSLE
jgi:hypothetical protein